MPQRVIHGRYRIIDVLGDGGMARVYRAVDERLGRTVALKTLHSHYNDQPDFVARFEREARLAASLSHPNIIAIHDIGSDAGTHYIVMEYVEGQTLKHLIDREAPLPLLLCATICRQICLALDEAHRHGIVHRDVKPENIFLTQTYHVKIGDFGIARALDTPGVTSTGAVIGSVHYISPEQAQGRLASAQSDIYGLGVVLYQMLTDHVPFVAANALAVAMKHIDEDPLPPSTFNPRVSFAIDAVVLTAMAKDPTQRYRSGANLSAALDQAIAMEAPEVAEPVSPENNVGSHEREHHAGAPLPEVAPVVAVDALDHNAEGQSASNRHSDAYVGLSSDAGPGSDTGQSDARLNTSAPLGVSSGSMSQPQGDGSANIEDPIPQTNAGTPITTTLYPVGGTRRPPALRPSSRFINPIVTPLPLPKRRHSWTPRLLGLLLLFLLAGGIIWGRGLLSQQSSPRALLTSTSGTHHVATGRTPPSTVPATSGPARTAIATLTATSVSHATDTPVASGAGSSAGTGSKHATSIATATKAADTPTPRPALLPKPQVTLSIARGVTNGYMPVGATRTLPLNLGIAYAIARWHGIGSGHSISFRWITPDSSTGNFTAPAQWGVAFAQVPLAIAGRYTVDIYADSHKMTSQSFTVTPPRGKPLSAASSQPSKPAGRGNRSPVPTHARKLANKHTPAPTHQTTNNPAPPQGAIGTSSTETQAATAAVNYANDVYMQVMNNRDTSNVSQAFGSALAATNRVVAAQLASKHQHWQIHLVSMTLSRVTLLSLNTALVGGEKTESAVLLADSGQVLDNHGTYTISFTDLVRQDGGRWRVEHVDH